MMRFRARFNRSHPICEEWMRWHHAPQDYRKGMFPLSFQQVTTLDMIMLQLGEIDQ